MSIADRLLDHYENKKFCKVMRQVAPGKLEKSDGYIVGYNDEFVLMREVYDFVLDGYHVFPRNTIAEVRFDKFNRYYDRILRKEGINTDISNEHAIDLTSWATIFRSIKKKGLPVIVENEDPEDESFDIGPITKVTQAAVYVRYFNAAGYLNETPTRILWKFITIAQFDDRYSKIFSKHLRERKPKPQNEGS